MGKAVKLNERVCAQGAAVRVSDNRMTAAPLFFALLLDSILQQRTDMQCLSRQRWLKPFHRIFINLYINMAGILPIYKMSEYVCAYLPCVATTGT